MKNGKLVLIPKVLLPARFPTKTSKYGECENPKESSENKYITI